MSLRNKLLISFTGIIVVSLVAATLIISAVTRHAFERINEERTTALTAEFQREFNHRGDEILEHLQSIAGTDRLVRMAIGMNRQQPDISAYLNDAKLMADSERLDFLEIVMDDGTVVSSAQWPAKIGYKDSSLPLPLSASPHAFLRREDLPDGNALSLSGICKVNVGERPLYLVGGRKLDQTFLASLTLPPGMRAFLYTNLQPAFSPSLLIDSAGAVTHAELLAPLIAEAQKSGNEASRLVHWSNNAKEDEAVHAVPLPAENGGLPGVLLVGASRRPYVELKQHINLAGLLVGGGGILLTILLSGWAAGRVTRPLRELAAATETVAGGDLHTQVWIRSNDEVGKLADSFNRMTRELSDQRQQLLQSERVAAWRELARPLAHELKNPLFPLQLTVENMIRAREHNPQQFDEVFRESTQALLAEIRNLKTIISRFSDFSRMPQPVLRQVQVNELAGNAARLLQPQWQASPTPIDCRLELDDAAGTIAADADLLHRSITNLLLNAADAMPQGGTLTVRTEGSADSVAIEVCDTGSGLTSEECERLFTPYYTSKIQGTGLGLAIVQSIVADHRGRITVQSQPGQGTCFRIDLPRSSGAGKATEPQTSGASA